MKKKGSYDKILRFCYDLETYFEKIPKSATFVTIYTSPSFNSSEQMKIGVVAKRGLKLKPSAYKNIKQIHVKPYKAFSHVHKGSGRLLSLIWKSFDEYIQKLSPKPDKQFPFGLEIYHLTSLNGETNEDKHVFELQVPVE